MTAIAPVTDRFISAVRRRMVLVRVAESIAVAVACASGAGVVLAGVLWWRGMEALLMIVGLWGLGVCVGMVWGMSRWPSRMEAAVEADEQLGLDDLLGTMVKMGAVGESGWRKMVAEYAERRCGELRASDVIVAKIGMRGWAGVGVLGLLVMTVGMLAGKPAAVNADVAGLGVGVASSTERGSAGSGAVFSNAVDRPPGAGGVDDQSSRGFSESSAAETGSFGNGSRLDGEMNAGAGGGVATTAPPLSGKSGDRLGEGKGVSSGLGEFSVGSGREDSGANVGGENRSTSVSGSGGAAVLPWGASGWVGDADAAEGAIQAGRVPEGDAELVRDYFRRE